MASYRDMSELIQLLQFAVDSFNDFDIINFQRQFFGFCQLDT